MKLVSPFLEYTKPQLLTFYNAFATPTNIVKSKGTGVTGCLYDSSGRLIKISQRFGGFCGDFFPSLDPDLITENGRNNARHISGKGLYLGHFMPQYGHFLLETLSTFWLCDRFGSYDYFLFQPFVFGMHIPEYVIEAFKMLELPLKKIIFVDKYLKLEHIEVPERLVKLNHSANVNLRVVFNRLTERACISSNGSKVDNQLHRYYISRRNTSWLKGTRVIINEPLLERKMEELGFRIIYPEKMNFREQIKTMASADVLVGLSGSALHNCVFMRPNSLLVELCDIRSLTNFHPMQSICNLLGLVNAACVPFRGIIVDPKMQMGFINISETVNIIKQELGTSNSDTIERSNALGSDRSIRLFSDLALMTKSCLRVLFYRAGRLWKQGNLV